MVSILSSSRGISPKSKAGFVSVSNSMCAVKIGGGSYGLDDWAIRIRSSAEARGFFLWVETGGDGDITLCFETTQGCPNIEDFSFYLYVQTGCGAHPASYTVGTGDVFPGAKTRPGRDGDHSPPSRTEVKNE
jgi:hypothetical protein